MMNRKTLNTILTIAGTVLGIAGLALILVSVFSDRNTLVWGMICVALGSLCSIILTYRAKKSAG